MLCLLNMSSLYCYMPVHESECCEHVVLYMTFTCTTIVLNVIALDSRPAHSFLYVIQYITCTEWQHGVMPWCLQNYIDTSRLCRTLFGYCPQPALGSRKADMKTLSFVFPTPFPCHVRAQAAIKPRHHGRQSCLCLAPISFMPWTW